MTERADAARARTDAALAATHAGVTARLLATGAIVSACSACAVVIAAVALVQASPVAPLHAVRAWGLWCIVAAGLPAAWYAWRVRLDAGLFADLAQTLTTTASTAPALAELDAALLSLGLLHAKPLTPRSLAQRCAGVRRLLAAQASIAILQWLSALALLLPVAR